MNILKSVFLVGLCFVALPANAQNYRGQYTINPYAPNATMNPPMGSEYSTDGPKLYDSKGNFRGNLNENKYDPNSVSNPYGRYGSEYSPDSIKNEYGAGSKYNPDSPYNPYGKGLAIIE